MKFNESWLKVFINFRLDSEALGNRLTMAGLELDSVETAAPTFSGVIVARIEAIEAHPNADKLRVCQVDTGAGGERLQVICGAANARRDMRVALARVGAALPGGMRIKQARLRGIASFGMLCSAAELGLADASDGIMGLPDDAPLGQNLREFMGLDDLVFEVDLTPNRADCLSLRGIARELAVLTGETANLPKPEVIPPTHDATFPLEVQASADCPNYAGRIIKGINPTAETPPWMQERLRRCGIRSLSPLVDVTNYVMLELGQPMHAFDPGKLEGGIVVRQARAGEPLTLLDGKVIELDDQTLVIADQNNALALAGVMGGKGSAVDEQTTNIFLESAFFRPETIAGKARGYGLHTESSHRFERGVDFRLQKPAIERATALILEICGGEPGPVIEAVSAEHLPVLEAITLRRDTVPRLLGISLEDMEIERILGGLGCTLLADEQGWRVTPPSYRFDLRIEVDLVEELARVHGYDNIPAHSRNWAPEIAAEPEGEVDPGSLKSRLNDLGYQEVISYSFIDPETERLLNPDYKALALSNPISSELAVMRTTLFGGLLQVIRHNQRRQQPRVRIFESGLVFLPGDSGLKQYSRIGGAVTGNVFAEQWGYPEREADFFDLKGDIEVLLHAAGLERKVRWEPSAHPALHPGQAAEILLDGVHIGLAGALHPEIQKRLDLEQRVFLFEFESTVLRHGAIPVFKALSRFPAVRRDLAIVVDENVNYAGISRCIDSLELDLISDFQVFDVYKGKGVANGRKSLALGLILQDLSRTLGDDDVERVIALVLEKLRTDIGASLRE